MFCSFSYTLLFIVYKITTDHFKDENKPSLNAKDRLIFSQDLILNHVREKLNHNENSHMKY